MGYPVVTLTNRTISRMNTPKHKVWTSKKESVHSAIKQREIYKYRCQTILRNSRYKHAYQNIAAAAANLLKMGILIRWS